MAYTDVTDKLIHRVWIDLFCPCGYRFKLLYVAPECFGVSITPYRCRCGKEYSPLIDNDNKVVVWEVKDEG